MATLRIRVNGSLGQISADSFAAVLQRSLQVLHNLDRRLSEQRGGTLRWVITGIGEGSAWIDLGTRIVRGQTDYAPRVHGSFTGGIREIRDRHGTPAYFSPDDVWSIHEIVRQIGSDGVTSVHFGPPPEEISEAASVPEDVEITHDIEPELQRLTGVKYRALGSIEGIVELVSVRRRARRFNITETRTQRPIRCNLPEALEESVFQAIQQRRRVVAIGLISYNARNEPLALFTDKPLRFLGRPEDLPTAAELAGSDLEITGAEDTEDFVRSLRDG